MPHPVSKSGKYIPPLMLLILLSACSEKHSQSEVNDSNSFQNAIQPQQTQTTPEAKTQPDRYANYPRNQPIVHRQQAGELREDGWTLAGSNHGSFSVLLPGLFLDSMVITTTQNGGTGAMHTVITKTKNNFEFSVLETELVDDDIKSSPEVGLISRFEELGATIQRTEVTIAETAAVRLSVSAPPTEADFLLLSKDNHHYMLAVQTRDTSQAKRPAADVETFFNSFRFATPKK